MRALVTGGTGFIGRRLVRALVEQFGSASVACFIRPAATPLEAEAFAAYRSAGLRLIEGDLIDAPISASAPQSVDVVFHLAGNIDTDAPESELRANDAGTRRLLEWLAPVSRGTRIVYASSVAVHDRAGEPNGPISENSPFTPRTAYGRTKLKGENILREEAASGGYSWTILRLPTVYGPGQKPDGLFDKLLHMTSRGALLGRINWPGRTSIIYVDDVADVMIDLAGRAEAAGEIYCVASDDQVTVGEVAQRVGNVIGRPVEPIDLPVPALRVARMLAWSRLAQAAMPPFARLSFWRLSLVVSDGFWFDTTKFRRVYRKRLRTLEEGLAETLAGRSG